jgi:hypothetical protein
MHFDDMIMEKTKIIMQAEYEGRKESWWWRYFHR